MSVGRRPQAQHDGAPLPPALAIQIQRHGVDFGFKCVLLWVKGDWSEVSHSLGLPSCVRIHCSCPFCTLTQPMLHTCYSSKDFPTTEQAYDEMCSAREIVVPITTEAARQLVMSKLHFPKGDKDRGRLVNERIVVGTRVLDCGDRLDPTPSMTDIMLFDTKPLPFEAVFWRTRRDGKQRDMDPVVRRNPLFMAHAGCSPAEVLAVDALHTVYYGPVMRWSSAVLWRVLLSNPWGLGVDNEKIFLESAVRRLRADMLAWFEDAGIPHSRRISDWTLPMMGSSQGCHVRGNTEHPGTALKVKAAEQGVVMLWALDLLRRHGHKVLKRSDLQIAGAAIERWLAITRHQSIVLPASLSQELSDSCQRHLLFSCKAGISFVPKHHFFAHLSLRAYQQGNPKAYACWTDESLNKTLRNVASKCHRSRQEERIFSAMSLIGVLRPEFRLFGFQQLV